MFRPGEVPGPLPELCDDIAAPLIGWGFDDIRKDGANFEMVPVKLLFLCLLYS